MLYHVEPIDHGQDIGCTIGVFVPCLIETLSWTNVTEELGLNQGQLTSDLEWMEIKEFDTLWVAVVRKNRSRWRLCENELFAAFSTFQLIQTTISACIHLTSRQTDRERERERQRQRQRERVSE
jgi:hypothetical protein